MKFELEPRYTVIKDSDAVRYLSEQQRQQLADLAKIVEDGRAFDERHPFECLCIERDWPEYAVAYQLMAERVEGEEKPPLMQLCGVPFDQLPDYIHAAYYQWQDAQTAETEANFHNACKRYINQQLYK